MELKKISPKISYLPASEPPLSADVGVISANNTVWIYDVGSNDEAASLINGIKGKNKEIRIVISHFHADHIANISRLYLLSCDKIYCGGFTRKKLGGIENTEIIVVDKDLYFDEGVHLFPVPSSHAKGCVGLETDGYAFLGDSTYCEVKNGKVAYNAGQLQGLIKTLKALDADKVLLSHNEPFVCGKEEKISELEKIYSLRKKEEPYIYLKGSY